jgi:hypothetical protein
MSDHGSLLIQFTLFIAVAPQSAQLSAAVFLGITGTASVNGKLTNEGQTVASIHEVLSTSDPLTGFVNQDAIGIPWALEAGDLQLLGGVGFSIEAKHEWSPFHNLPYWYVFSLGDSIHDAFVFPGEDPNPIGWDVVMDTQIMYRMWIDDIREDTQNLQHFGSYRSDSIEYAQPFGTSTFESTWTLVGPDGELANAINQHESSFHSNDLTLLKPGILELRTSMRTHFWRDENSGPIVFSNQNRILHYAIANLYVDQVVPEPQLAAMLIWVAAGVRRKSSGL